MKDQLKNAIRPIYSELLKNLESNEDLYPFCAQWGNNFAEENDERILFVGKATNGWCSNSRDVNVLFGESKERIFNRSDQLKWVQNLRGNKEGYNTSKSAFWRVVTSISEIRLNKVEALSSIAWSNLYKISYEEGNPNEKLKKFQKEYCKQILEKEIQIFKPKFVIFLTSGWEQVFLRYLNSGTQPEPIGVKKWGKNYFSKSYQINDTLYISSYHPQGKKEDLHVNAILSLMEEGVQN